MKKRIFLQLFAEDAGGAGGAESKGGTETQTQTQQEGKTEDQPKYTDADVDRLISQKFAEWSKKQEKTKTEAERLANMTAEEKAAERVKALEDKIKGYEAAAARAEMTKQARTMLQDKNLHVSDELLSNLIAEDAETTKASVESFITLFSSAVEKAVKEALKTETPTKGSASGGMTKEQILSVANRVERQRLISENMHLFK